MQLKRPYDYDRERFGHILDWDQYSFKINGERIFIFSGEFHYWRVPDRERWKDVLLQYKAGGLNCIRIYFHWGFHSPSEKKYIFTGNRDLEYLFTLCEELGLWVLCAPGPYICAETTAGGYPPWLLAQEDVLIRHQKSALVSRYDPAFAAYSRRWLAEFVPIMARHERTTNPGGCVIGLQIENEHIRKKIFQFGLDRHMEDLAGAVREFGATTPLFHNDAMEMGSWAGGDDPDKSALVDIYGFDRYIIWCPRKYDRADPPGWDPNEFARAIRGTEERVRGFGGRAKLSPIFLVELQGGWFNQWGHDHGFDEVYDFYGDEYTRTITESFMNEGMTMVSLYMYYGGTNWGTLGDPDVYTSYDYGACIREFGYLSDRLRKVRRTAYFARSFQALIGRTDAAVPKALCAAKDVVSGQRSGPGGVQFIFLRNFDRQRRTDFDLEWSGLRAPVRLAWRDSMIAVARYQTQGFFLELASLAWIARLDLSAGEFWIFEEGPGLLAFRGPVNVENGTVERSADAAGQLLSLVRFAAPGLARITNENGAELRVLILSKSDALSLAIDFDAKRLAYGAYGLVFDGDRLLVETTGEQTVRLLGASAAPGFQSANGTPDILQRKFAGPQQPARLAENLGLRDWRSRPFDWNALSWQAIDIDRQANPLLHGFHSGHIAYRVQFSTISAEVDLSLNVRHRAAVWCNGEHVGGQITYGYSMLSPGAKNGPDLTLLGSHRHSLGAYLHADRRNEAIVLVESLGYNRGPFTLCDFRNPRGILHARLNGRVANERWSIFGVDVGLRDEIFNTASLPGEAAALAENADWQRDPGAPTHWPVAPTWYAADFEFDKQADRRLPLRLHLTGRGIAHVFLNGLYIARYWGDFGPQQDFYLMDEVLRQGKNSLVLALYRGTRAPGGAGRTAGDDAFDFACDIRPYNINESSGNIDEAGPVFATARHAVEL